MIFILICLNALRTLRSGRMASGIPSGGTLSKKDLRL